jgi:hypothetical protein
VSPFGVVTRMVLICCGDADVLPVTVAAPS